MSEAPINDVLAQNLRYYMDLREIRSQAQLAERAGIAQRTVSNYLKPSNRTEGSKGKRPSAKLSELESIATALHVEVWELLRPLSLADRIIYRKIEEAFSDLRAAAAASAPVTVHEPRKRYGTDG
jgi:transcriptional regulator with XRE-family HTH domain